MVKLKRQGNSQNIKKIHLQLAKINQKRKGSRKTKETGRRHREESRQFSEHQKATLKSLEKIETQ